MIKKRTEIQLETLRKIQKIKLVRFFYILATEINSNVYHTKQPDFREIVAIYGCYIQVSSNRKKIVEIRKYENTIFIFYRFVFDNI